MECNKHKNVMIINSDTNTIESEFSLSTAILDNEISKIKLINWKEKHKIKKEREFIRENLGDFVKMYIFYTQKLVKDKDIKELDFKLLLFIVSLYGEQDNFDYTMMTHGEFAKELGFSHVAVQKSLKKLVDKGYLLSKEFGRNKRYAPNPYLFFKEGAKEQIEAIAELKKEKDLELWNKIKEI